MGEYKNDAKIIPRKMERLNIVNNSILMLIMKIRKSSIDASKQEK